MSETTPDAITHAPRPALWDPVGILLNLIITLLAPMFLTATGGNVAFARHAAAQALDEYRAECGTDLITIAKIIAFGLTTLSSLCLSMGDDISLTQILRLRSNANATDRSEHRNRQVLDRAPSPAPAPSEPVASAPPAPASPDTNNPDEQRRRAVLAAMADAIAAETEASLPDLPPEERCGASIWISALSEAASNFRSGTIPPEPTPPEPTTTRPAA